MKAWRELRRLPPRLWGLALASLVNRMGTMALPFLTLYLIRSLGFPERRAAAVLAVYGLTALCVGPLSGRLCDRFSPSKVMRVTLLCSSLILAAVPFCRTFPAICLSVCLWAAMAEAFRPAAMASVGEAAPPGMRKQAFALNRLAVNLGLSMGPALGGLIAARSFEAVFWVDSATSALAAFCVPAGLVAAAAGTAGSKTPSAAALGDRRLLYVLAALLPVAVVFFQHETSMPVFLVRDLRLTPTFYGLLFTLNTLMILAFEIPLNSAMAHWPYRHSLALGAFLYAVGYGALAFSATAFQVAATVAVWTFGEMILMPSLSAYVSEISPEDRKGEYMGLFIMTYSLGFLIGSSCGITTLTALGGRPFWALAFALGAASSILFLRVREKS